MFLIIKLIHFLVFITFSVRNIQLGKHFPQFQKNVLLHLLPLPFQFSLPIGLYPTWKCSPRGINKDAVFSFCIQRGSFPSSFASRALLFPWFVVTALLCVKLPCVPGSVYKFPLLLHRSVCVCKPTTWWLRSKGILIANRAHSPSLFLFFQHRSPWDPIINRWISWRSPLGYIQNRQSCST